MSLVLSFLDSCEGLELRAIAFERHECGNFRNHLLDSKVKIMEPVALGQKFISANVRGKQQLIAPSANVNGIVLRTTLIIGNGLSYVTTGATEPSYWTSPGVPVLLMLMSGGTTQQLQYPVYLPPGNGLWAYENNGQLQVFITYDVLPAPSA
ncbi:MAG: hypothetical protein ACN6P5_11950 [Pseudomonas protegens]|uniref:hypothetical protein n=1 Tax=Pseudomonas protegens TaxID=380021 RepID=UPI00383B257E